MTNTTHSDRAPSATKLREGFSLIEIIVAMSMIAIAFTSLMALQVKITQRQSLMREQASRNAILLQEVNRVESMRYDTLSTMLVSDTSFSTAFPYIRRYTLTTGYTPASTSQHPYTDVSIRIVPYANPSDSVYTTLRRTKTPSVNPLYTP
jgi:prepilin-type N-terminal cleavage/methylation domain-containing protein